MKINDHEDRWKTILLALDERSIISMVAAMFIVDTKLK